MANEKYVRIFSIEEIEKLLHSEKEIPQIRPLLPIKVKLNDQEFEIPPEDIKISYKALLGVDEKYQTGVEFYAEFDTNGNYKHGSILRKKITET